MEYRRNNEDFIIYTSKDIVNRIEEYPKVKKYLNKFFQIIILDNKLYGLYRDRNENFLLKKKLFQRESVKFQHFLM